MRRPLLDIASQAVPIASQVLERVVLVAVLVQQLGIEQFERWSVLLAAVTLLSILDMGAQITFSNRMANAAHAGDLPAATRIFRESNTIFLGLAALVMIGTLAMVFVAPVQRLLGLPVPLDHISQIVLAMLGSGVAVRMAVTNLAGAYRANLAFARGTIVFSLAETARSLLTVASVLLVPDLYTPAIVYLTASIVGFAVIVPLDIARHYPAFALRLAKPTSFTTHKALPEALMFSINYFPQIILLQIPVIIIGDHAATGVLTSFVLLRTMSNLLRLLIQRVATVIGMELGRFEVQGRIAVLQRTYQSTGLFVACLFGVTAGFLLAWGGDLIGLWTGKAVLFDPLLLAIMLAPLVLASRVQIALPYLVYSHRPAAIGWAVLGQTVAAVVMAVALPIHDVALRLTIAVYGSELIPMAPIVLIAAARAMHQSAIVQTAKDLILALSMALLTYAIGSIVKPHFGSIAGLALGSTLTAILGGGALALLFWPVLKQVFSKYAGTASRFGGVR